VSKSKRVKWEKRDRAGDSWWFAEIGGISYLIPIGGGNTTAWVEAKPTVSPRRKIGDFGTDYAAAKRAAVADAKKKSAKKKATKKKAKKKSANEREAARKRRVLESL